MQHHLDLYRICLISYLVTYVRTTMVPSIEVQTRKPAVHLVVKVRVIVVV